MATAPDWVSVQVVTATGATEHCLRPPAPPCERPCPLPVDHVRWRAAGAARLLEASKLLAHLCVKGIYLFPALLLVKLGLRLAAVRAGDYLTVAFVGLVVITFALLSLVALLHVLAGPRSLRQARRTTLLGLPGPARAFTLLGTSPAASAAELARLAQAGGDAGVRVRGRVDAGAEVARGTRVLAERWVESEGRVVRVVEGRSFAVVLAAGPPVVLDLGGCPRLLGPYGSTDAPSAGQYSERLLGDLGRSGALPALAGARLAGCELCQGDEVELTAERYEPVAADALEAAGRPLVLGRGGAAAPYRGEAARVLRVAASPAVSVYRHVV